jgi:peptidoglycan hydrolase-like protein with peptidoglycan-binding domain
MKNKINTSLFSKSALAKVGAVTLSVLFVATPLFTYAATLNRELSLGMSGADVSTLQTYLSHDESIYPQKMVTGYFGGFTKIAVMNYQNSNSIPMVGRVGPSTLASLNIKIPLDGTGVAMPTISKVSIVVSSNSARLNWGTDESTRGLVFYSTNPLTTYEHWNVVDISGSQAMTDLNLHDSQSVLLSNLQPNTTYYYMVEAVDRDNNISVTWPSTFQTPSY